MIEYVSDLLTAMSFGERMLFAATVATAVLMAVYWTKA